MKPRYKEFFIFQMNEMLASKGDNSSSASSSQSDLSTVETLDSNSSHTASLASINNCKCRNQTNKKLDSTDIQSNNLLPSDQSYPLTQGVVTVTACCGRNQKGCCKDIPNGSIDNSISGLSDMTIESKKPDPSILDF